MTARFTGRVALVTGAGSGIGRASAERLASEGARVACLDIFGADGIAESIAADGGDAMAVTCDVRDQDSVVAAVAAAASWGGRLDVLANIAGVGRFMHFADVTLEEWNRIIGINLTGTFLVTHAAMPYLLERGGAVVNMASTAAVRANPYAAAYCASKAGVVMLTRSLAIEYGMRGVRVNAVCPGGVDTGITAGFALPEGADPSLRTPRGSRLGRRGEPEEIAAAVAYLASDDASFISGTTLVVDGAATA